MTPSVLATLRHAGVTVTLAPGDALDVQNATAAQLEAIRANKPQIVQILKAEAFGGEAFGHSGLCAGIRKTMDMLADAYDCVTETRDCVMDADALLCRFLDGENTAWKGVRQATETYLNTVHPTLSVLVAKVNAEMAQMLEGKRLKEAVELVFEGKIKQPRKRLSI